jgi:hypothetical protein
LNSPKDLTIGSLYTLLRQTNHNNNTSYLTCQQYATEIIRLSNGAVVVGHSAYGDDTLNFVPIPIGILRLHFLPLANEALNMIPPIPLPIIPIISIIPIIPLVGNELIGIQCLGGCECCNYAFRTTHATRMLSTHDDASPPTSLACTSGQQCSNTPGHQWTSCSLPRSNDSIILQLSLRRVALLYFLM